MPGQFKRIRKLQQRRSQRSQKIRVHPIPLIGNAHTHTAPALAPAHQLTACLSYGACLNPLMEFLFYNVTPHSNYFTLTPSLLSRSHYRTSYPQATPPYTWTHPAPHPPPHRRSRRVVIHLPINSFSVHISHDSIR